MGPAGEIAGQPLADFLVQLEIRVHQILEVAIGVVRRSLARTPACACPYTSVYQWKSVAAAKWPPDPG